ncbi:MAG: peptidyl-prolyl cis-trans isomerase [Campylobacteraceae bacterium]|nr:peptidyl-prolyl cis-trans isomerase [Campylobacteraceae bacterium]
MNKIFLSLILLSVFTYAGLINALAIKVNDKMISLYDIDLTMENKNISKEKAVSFLIDKLLFDEELEKNNITLDIFDVNDYLEKLAKLNGMDLYAFKSLIKQKYQDSTVFDEEIKQKILNQKLTQVLLRGNLNIANDEDMKIYYENNKNIFQTSVSTDVRQYASKNKKDLIQIKNNPMVVIKSLKIVDSTLENKKLSSQLKYILNETEEGKFTSIFTSNKHYVMLYIKKKAGHTIQDFESSKNIIFRNIMKNREHKFLNEYFKKKKISANIEIIR